MKRFSAGNLRKLPKLDATGNPVVPGWYYWDVWTAAVHVTKRKGRLQVCPPGGVHVDVTANLAGELTPISEEQQLAWAEKVRLEGLGWTKADFAKALRNLLEKE